MGKPTHTFILFIMNIERLAAQTLIDLPVTIKINGKNGEEIVTVQPLTLGKMQMLSNLFLKLELDWNSMATAEGVMQELLRVASTETDTIAEIIAITLENNPKRLRNQETLNQRTEHIKEYNTYADFARIILVVFEKINPATFTMAMRLAKILNLNAPSPNGETRRIA